MDSSRSNSPTVTYYDIILDPKAYPMSPNPWKARYALNFTGVPYRTTWVPLNAVASTRSSLHLPAVRKHMDGSDFPTLPILRDPLAGGADKTDAAIGDSFDIALHLQRTYLSPSSSHPGAGNPDRQLFPGEEVGSGSVALHRAFNYHVDQLFSQHGAPLAGCGMPFDPRTAEADKAAMMERFPGQPKWDDLIIPPGAPVRRKMMEEFEAALDGKLAPCFEGKGPFMDGRRSPMYADFIVGGWLQFLRGCLPEGEWREVRDRFSGGRWGRLFDALEEWTAVDGREGVVPAKR